MQPGVVERPEYEYLRHGTQCLIANFDVATGEVVPSTAWPYFLAGRKNTLRGHIAHTLATDPEAPWLFIVDQLNIHKSEASVRLCRRGLWHHAGLGEKE